MNWNAVRERLLEEHLKDLAFCRMKLAIWSAMAASHPTDENKDNVVLWEKKLGELGIKTRALLPF